jgi:hypothetical protein
VHLIPWANIIIEEVGIVVVDKVVVNEIDLGS